MPNHLVSLTLFSYVFLYILVHGGNEIWVKTWVKGIQDLFLETIPKYLLSY